MGKRSLLYKQVGFFYFATKVYNRVTSIKGGMDNKIFKEILEKI